MIAFEAREEMIKYNVTSNLKPQVERRHQNRVGVDSVEAKGQVLF